MAKNKQLVQAVLSVHPAKVNALDIAEQYALLSEALILTDPVSAHGYALWAQEYTNMGDVEIDWFEIHTRRTFDDGHTESVSATPNHRRRV